MAAKSRETLLSNADLNLLYDVSSSISSIQDLDKMLKNILQTIKTEFQVEGASIALHDASRNEFYFIRTVEEQKNGAHVRMDTMRFPDHFGVAGWVRRENSAVIITDISADDRFSNELDFQQKLKVRSMICVPLRTRKALIGVLYAINKLSGDFSIKESRLLEILSGTIAMAIENARMYGEIKQQADRLVKENVRLRSEVQEYFNVQGIIGSSAAMRAVFSLLEKVVNTDTSVFIQGETGTGKELIAKVIHYNSPMKDRPFVAENCGALSENLLESELFGHVKGAFTGAIADKKGIFEMADGGTVFLDEIADMPYAMQIKLLRVLQEGQVRPVGAGRFRQVEFRLITSSNRDLQDAVAKKGFRDDLFYRIHVFPVVLPPLRERKEDIPLLADHFLKKFAGKRSKPASHLTPRALEHLVQYAWPGNVRELEHEIERALTLAGEDTKIGENYLSEKIRGGDQSMTTPPKGQLSLQEATRTLERRMVTEALDETNGNRSQAARLLGLTRQGLLNKIARYKIDI